MGSDDLHASCTGHQLIWVLFIGYTDLAAQEDVQWRPKPRDSPTICKLCFHGPDVCQCSPRSSSNYADSEDSEDSDIDQDDSFCCGKCRPEAATLMCFCSKSDSYRFSTTCVCLRKRHALFSVSREVREDAITVYYSRNRIVVTPEHSPDINDPRFGQIPSWLEHNRPTLARVELSLYTSSLSQSAMKSIRWLEWILPGFEMDYLPRNSPHWRDYVRTLDMMRQTMNTRNLTFVLNMGAQEHSDSECEETGLGEPISGTGCHRYQIALALRRLRPLKDCFIHLSRRNGRLGFRFRDRCESWLEKEIMGKDYDSKQRGKPKERVTATAERNARS